MTTATQYLLPFREFQVPAWALHAFRVANACAYYRFWNQRLKMVQEVERQLKRITAPV